MTVTAGALSQISVGSNSAKLLSAPATAGVGPYTYQWYRSTVTPVVVGGGTIIAGATALTLDDSGLIPNNTYYYLVRATDTGASSATDDSPELTVVTSAQSLSQNQFAQRTIVGQLDQHFNYNTTPVQIDVSQVGDLFAGSAVKMVDSAGGVPKVIGCDANDDEVLGFINYDIKTQVFLPGAAAEISGDGNVMYLYATTAIARGAQVTLAVEEAPGAVAAANTGDTLVGWTMDKATAAGALVRIKLSSPSFAVA